MCEVTPVVSNSATPWAVPHQASLSMGFSRQGYWSGLPCPLPGDLPNPGIKPVSLTSPALACVLSHFGHVQLFVTPGLWPIRLLYIWDSLGKNTEAGCHALLQGIFPIQGLNPSLLHCRWICYCLSHQGMSLLTTVQYKIKSLKLKKRISMAWIRAC